MYINEILSSMGAWDKLTENRESLFHEIQEALESQDIEQLQQNPEEFVGRLHQGLNMKLDAAGWAINQQISLTGGKHTFYSLDFHKDMVGGKLVLGKQAFILSSLLAHFPLSIQLDHFDLGFVLMPMASLKPLLARGTADFESFSRVLEELSPLLIRYPYLIMGFSNKTTPLQVTELTSELDQFLLTNAGYTLQEMLVLGEKPSYDFKLTLPEKIENITKEVCAMANLEGGGILLFGISDDGDLLGIPSTELDTAKLRITNSVRALLDPIPSFHFAPFEHPEDPRRIFLLCRIDELKRKPCLLHHRAYVRSGPSAQAADSEEMRKLILGSVQE